jgi:N-acetylglutamate synthase-like GNAT family acetyltransferase
MIINLKKKLYLLDGYIKLRNKYSKNLLTQKTTIEETEAWLKNTDIEVICSIKNEKITGACILHIYRNGEITIFVAEKNKGLGSRLLREIEMVATKRHLKKIWAWTDISNLTAVNFFLKNGYIKRSFCYKNFSDKKLKGIIFEKIII